MRGERGGLHTLDQYRAYGFQSLWQTQKPSRFTVASLGLPTQVIELTHWRSLWRHDILLWIVLNMSVHAWHYRKTDTITLGRCELMSIHNLQRKQWEKIMSLGWPLPRQRLLLTFFLSHFLSDSSFDNIHSSVLTHLLRQVSEPISVPLIMCPVSVKLKEDEQKEHGVFLPLGWIPREEP